MSFMHRVMLQGAALALPALLATQALAQWRAASRAASRDKALPRSGPAARQQP